MKTKAKIVSLLVYLIFLYGCSGENSFMDAPQTSLGKKAQVVLTLSVPEVSLPLATRSITDDKAIDNFVLWAFDNQERFLYQIGSNDKDPEGNSKIIVRGNKVYALLPESESEVTLVMIANNGVVTAPALYTPKDTALPNLKFTYSRNTNYIPMCGESVPFIVTEGATPGTILLTRALARIEVDASHATPFILNSVEVINVNSEGTVISTNITNATQRMNIESNATDNKWTFYIPEAIDVGGKNNPNARTSLILKGVNKEGNTRFYRLDFIKRTQTAGEEVKYEYIQSIERNHRYVFRMEHIVSKAGNSTRNDALTKERADNGIINTKLMIIDDENIRDITTDNEFYLGVTWSQLDASMKEGGDGLYYTANMSIATNNPEGWKIEDLPSQIQVSIKEWKYNKNVDKDQESAISVWIYINKDKVKVNDTFPLYVYSGNIRKTITINII